MGKINVIYEDLYLSANNLVTIIDYLKQAKDQLDDISKEIETINKKHSCYSKTEQGIADLTRDFANYITEVTFLQNQCTKAATAFKNAEGKNAKVTDEIRNVINDGATMLGIEKITDSDINITAYKNRSDFVNNIVEHWNEASATDTSQTWKNTFVEGNDKMVSINSDLSTKAESIIDPEKEAEKQEEPEEQKPDEEPKTEPEEPKQDYNPPKGTTPSEEKTEGDKQEKAEGDKQKKSEEETKNPKTDEGNKPKEETTTKTETSKDSSKEPKKEEPSTVTPPSETKTETTTTTTTPTTPITPTEPQQETYVPPAETNNNNNYNNYSNETPINNNVETGEETMTTEPEIPKGSDETAPSPEVPDDEIVKGNEYTKIPTSDTPIETKHKSGNGFIPIAAGLSAAAAAGIGAKVYMDRKNNNDNGEDDFTSEELNSDESTISNQIDNNTQEDTNKDNTPEEDNINNDDYSAKPEKYGARNNNEIADLQQ